jgi:hypothetical protein
MVTTKPNPRRGDPEASDECRHSARISQNLPPIMVETGLAGWGARIRTWKWPKLLPILPFISTIILKHPAKSGPFAINKLDTDSQCAVEPGARTMVLSIPF